MAALKRFFWPSYKLTKAVNHGKCAIRRPETETFSRLVEF